ncbi:hypothetical protein [Citrifermentans bremense]|uniref:hypothetical protein n=1 Tax=Citrifermentans bremense TaxID=60035 RepID=UPI00047C1EFE|nr:hypothetical protein [Citrifermentans bremense]
MPVTSLWSLLLVAVAAAFALTLKVAELNRTIKRIDHESDLLRAELDAIKKQKNEAESRLLTSNQQTKKKKTSNKVDFTGVYLR